MEKSKTKIMPSLETAIEIVKELKIFHSSYYGDAVDVVLTELLRLQESIENAHMNSPRDDDDMADYHEMIDAVLSDLPVLAIDAVNEPAFAEVPQQKEIREPNKNKET